MEKHNNIPLRVEAYNRQFKNSESKIFIKEGADPFEATSYSSQLYEKYVQKGGFLEVKDGMYLFIWKIIHPMGIRVRALNFLQVLAYLEFYDELLKEKHLKAMAVIKQHNEREKAKQLTKEEESQKKIELEEKDGVTFIKNTNFVISKIM
ncbi:hypothetical protein [Rufibacter roseus]|uniref:Uncharacterized protein n=1 Tax=Rufibacter roseus TaxID=1567108 RepID=A0ABW2DH50_9BACT|nr:hypothetical protein [Rufibacter roseus]